MTRYVALLRAINVGGRTVKMDALRAVFGDLGFGNVETFIASGNVLFEAPGKPAVLESQIETALNQALGQKATMRSITTVEKLATILSRN